MNSLPKKSILIIYPFPKDFAVGKTLNHDQYWVRSENLVYKILISKFLANFGWKIIYKKIYDFLQVYPKRLKDILSLEKYDLVF